MTEKQRLKLLAEQEEEEVSQIVHVIYVPMSHMFCVYIDIDS